MRHDNIIVTGILLKSSTGIKEEEKKQRGNQSLCICRYVDNSRDPQPLIFPETS